MKIFDSNRNKNWKGKGFELNKNSILLLKSASIIHPINIKSGEYNFKLLGKKRTGDGKIKVEIFTEYNYSLLNENIKFTNNSWSELNFKFNSPKNLGNSFVKISRPKNVYGTVELGRLYLEHTSEDYKRQINSIKNNSRINSIKNKKIIEFTEVKKNINLLFIIPYGIYGGGEIYIKNIIERIPDNYNISIIYLKPNNLQNNLNGKNIYHRVIKRVEQLNDILKNSNYDHIVYYNRYDVYELLSNLKGSGSLKSSLVEIYHSDFVWPGSLSMLRERKNIDKFISIAPSLGRDIVGIKNKYHIVPVGIDLNKFKPRDTFKVKEKLGITTSSKIIGTVSRLSKEKNLDYILRLAKLMPEYEFWIAGDGNEKISLVKRINSRDIKNVKLLGFVKNIELYYNIFDAFILSSKIEGTPISIIEAMASGVPVFSNMVGAIPDLIEDGVTGYKITGNPEEDKDIILKNIYSLDIIENAKDFIINNHDIEKIGANFINTIISSQGFFEEIDDKNRIILSGEFI